MAIDFNVPQSLMQYKSYEKLTLTGEKVFIFDFPNYNNKIHTLRVLKNGKILPSDEYTISGSPDDITIRLKNIANINDIIHLDVFMPLSRYTEYSICTLDYTIPCETDVSSYILEFEYYNEKSCKLQIFHSTMGFIPKDSYEVKDGNIIFNGLSFYDGEILYVKVIQDGGILLQ